MSCSAPIQWSLAPCLSVRNDAQAVPFGHHRETGHPFAA
jgi:hypothetical protein